MIRRPPRSTQSRSSAASDVYKRQVLITGGSAFGLDAAGGVVRFLEEKGIGFPTPGGLVPVVSAAVLFDLDLGDAKVRPDEQMAYQACLNASVGEDREGLVAVSY